ncbi:MAG: glycosyltransferase, partial [Bacteroidota bacterium]
RFSEAKLIVNQQNTGFAVANNQAIRQSTGKYILLLNPDTIVREDTFQKCVEFMETYPDAGGLGVKMIDGSGKFLPESKRGFPSPFVAFCKTFGLSALFPKSKTFNRYHLGFLDPEVTHPVDVLAGAFMLLRRDVLDKIGLLDEAFFMYGEDIDLSYRIVQAGYKNYYFPGTTIVHYKGESTKKGSLNYVRTFYQAMLIFAKKHFTGRQARLFVAMIYAAIWLRAGLTLVGNFFKKSRLPVLDGALLAIGLVLAKNFWANYFYQDPGWFKPEFLYFNIPLYVGIWLATLFFSGGYDEPFNLRRLTRGLLLGTVAIAAVYGFLPLELRPSRAVIVLGTGWALLTLTLLRTAFHFSKTGNLSVGKARPANLVIVGSAEESERVQQLLIKAGVRKNFIMTVPPPVPPNSSLAESPSAELEFGGTGEIETAVEIYKVDEIIFCLKDLSAAAVMHWMQRLGDRVECKTVPEGSQSIIGSSSKNTAGELYTLDVRFNIAAPAARRSKRMSDLLLAVVFLILAVGLLPFVKDGLGFLRNIFQVLFGKKTWVGYAVGGESAASLPKIRPGVLAPADAFPGRHFSEETVRRLDFFYAKDYEPRRDLEIISKCLRDLGKTR